MISKKTFCSICTASCGLEVDIEDNRIIAIRGDADNAMSQGYTCVKGRNAHLLLNTPDRLTAAMARNEAGALLNIPGTTALDQIAEQLQATIDQYGPRSVAVFGGNGITFKSTAMPAARAFLKSFGSHMIYSTMTIDQPAKFIAPGRHGFWAAGRHSFATSDVLMLIGNNPIVSGYHCGGSFPGWRPGELKKARKRGLKLIVVDPRKTETAEQADIYLPVQPGQDAVLLAGMLKLILDEQRHDREFCREYTEGLEQLHTALADFDITTVAERTGLPQQDIVDAARLFADAKRGTASTGTGPNMALHANLTEHLAMCLNTACGRLNRAGDRVVSPAILSPDLPVAAMALPREAIPTAYNFARNPEVSRIRGARQILGEMPTATLAEEILTPGEGQVKAMIVIGGNPVMSFPDQQLTIEALKQLDLLVCIDVRMNETCTYADYVLPASYGLERDEVTGYNNNLYEEAYGQYAQAAVAPPAEAREEWQYFAELARRMNLALKFRGGILELDALPTSKDFINLLFPPGKVKVSIEELSQYPSGNIFEAFNQQVVQPPGDEQGKLDFYPEGIPQELNALKSELNSNGTSAQFPFLMVSRRDKHVFNSMCHELPSTPAGNPLYMHPEDIRKLSLSNGDLVSLVSEHGEVIAELAADNKLRRGVVAMTHCFGAVENTRTDVKRYGASAAQLVTTREYYNSYANMPRLSAIPVAIRSWQESG